MDVTDAFCSAVRRCRAARELKTPSSDIMKPIRKKSPFFVAATQIANEVHKMRSFLVQNRADYVNVARHIPSQASTMSDAERDAMDTKMMDFIKQCDQRIEGLLPAPTSGDLGRQAFAHMHGVVRSLSERLQNLTKTFEQHRALRLQIALEDRRGLVPQPRFTAHQSASSFEEGLDPDDEPQLEIPEGVAQQLQEENRALENELNTLVDQVRDVESRALEVAALSHVFATKVLEEADEIDDLHTTAISNTENLKMGNEYVRRTTERSVDFRVLVLVVLVVLSLGLLFLDWYE